MVILSFLQLILLEHDDQWTMCLLSRVVLLNHPSSTSLTTKPIKLDVITPNYSGRLWVCNTRSIGSTNSPALLRNTDLEKSKEVEVSECHHPSIHPRQTICN